MKLFRTFLLSVAVFLAFCGEVPLPVSFDANNSQHAFAADVAEVNVKTWGATGNGVSDDTTAINSALAFAGSKANGGTVYFPAGVYYTTNSITVPNKVNIIGEKWGWTNAAGTAWDSGAVIYKAHNNDAVLVTSSNNSTIISNISIRSDKSVYTTGNGFVIGPAFNTRLIRTAVFKVGGDSFVIGDNTANSYTNTCRDCYSNNPGGRNFVIGGQWFVGDELRSDGGTIGIEFLNGQANYWSVGSTHFETPSTACWKVGYGRGETYGRNVCLPGGTTATGVLFVNNSGAYVTTLRGFKIINSPYNAGSVGVNIAGANNTSIVMEDSDIEGFGTGIIDAGKYNTIRGNVLSGNNLGINANGDIYTYEGNTISGTVGTYSIAHNAGTQGIWANNYLDKTINPVVSGVQGNFSGVKCRNNVGYVSRANGQTGAIASGSTIAHGLAGVPSADIVLTGYTAGVTSTPQITALDATNITLAWAGTSPAQWGWNVHLPCDP